MTMQCSVFRHKETLAQALSEIRFLEELYGRVVIDNRGDRFNTDLLDALELEALLGLAEAITVSALNRRESRGAHFRDDYPERNDEEWLKHTLIEKTDGEVRVFYKPVHITRFQPKPRTY
jgi:succinate dehydrogenase / fumarate reductase flavoprotein subunit